MKKKDTYYVRVTISGDRYESASDYKTFKSLPTALRFIKTKLKQNDIYCEIVKNPSEI